MEVLYQEADKLFGSKRYKEAEVLYTEFIEAVCPQMKEDSNVAFRGIDTR